MAITEKDTLACAEIRKDIFLTAYSGGVGHLASAFSLVEILYALYCNGIMNYDPQRTDWEERDRLILSKGHGSLALYNLLSRCGVIPREALWKFCQPSGMLGGEPHTLEVPGVEASTGSLGHGLSIGVGMALAVKTDQRNNHIYVIVGDGECEEGSIWEAVMSAAAFQLDCLTVIVDCNKLQKMDTVYAVTGIDTWRDKFEAFGWQVKECDGHNIDQLTEQLQGEWVPGKPRCLIAHTIKGKGLSLMEGNPKWHWKMPNRRELKVFMSELGISSEELNRC